MQPNQNVSKAEQLTYLSINIALTFNGPSQIQETFGAILRNLAQVKLYEPQPKLQAYKFEGTGPSTFYTRKNDKEYFVKNTF